MFNYRLSSNLFSIYFYLDNILFSITLFNSNQVYYKSSKIFEAHLDFKIYCIFKYRKSSKIACYKHS